ncbi:MAG TPA: PDZ domain-containing protein [Thermoanaerobaculia bacterium]|nr:PDZ domain-containing protein [Thermoanaerobaculia bacterium]
MKTSLQRLLPGMALASLAVFPACGQSAPPRSAQAAPSPAQPASPTLTVRPPMLINGIAASGDQIVFAFAGDLWRVGRAGGEARRIAELPGEEDSPAFSPDGSWLAFSRNTGGGGDVWVMPAAGGESRRLTWHPKEDRVRGWSPDGMKILFTTNRDGDGVWRLYTLALDGTIPEALPFPEGRQGAFSPDGSLLAVVPYSGSPVSWRHYRGGSVSPLWLARLADGKVDTVERYPDLTSPEANNHSPVWLGGTLYFISDRTGTPNLFSYDSRSGRTEQLTRYPKHGILFSSAAPDAIVFVADGQIHFWDPVRREDRTVDVHLTLPAPQRAVRAVPASRFLEQAALTPRGDRLIATARGEVLSLDPRSGQAENLTRTPGVAERSAVPSPDGRWIAYFSDASGEYELHVRPAAGAGEVRRLAVEEHPSFYRELTWSPDGRRLAFSDKRLSLWVADLEPGTIRKIATSRQSGQDVYVPAWSPDGRWLAFAQILPRRIRTVFLWDAEDGRVHQVTDGKTESDLPAFDRSGRYLFFTASNNARTASAGWGVMSSVLARPLVTSRLQALVLRQGDPPPLLPILDKPHPEARWEPAAGAVRIDLDGMARRIVPVADDSRDFVGLAAGPPGVLFAQVQEWQASPAAGDPALVLYRYALNVLSEGAEPEKIATDVRDFTVSADGGTLLYRTGEGSGASLTLAPSLAPADAERKPLDLAGVRIEIDPAAEWQQIYRESWRIARDWFYDPGHHGQDLADLERHFAAYLPGVARRDDLNSLLIRMLGYLSISHLVVAGGDVPPPAGKPEGVGLLGADYVIDQGRYRISRIYRSGQPSSGNPLLRAPLDQPGVDVREGDYLLAVDGAEIRAERSLESYFVGKASKPVEIRIAAEPDGREARTATVVPLPGENTLRRMDWAERNRRRVEELSGGRLAYVYVPNHGEDGYEELLRGVLGNLDAGGAIIDQRWSPGGIVFDAPVELLRRQPIYAYAWREGDAFPMPTNFVTGPKVLIINRQNGSAAETFALMWKLTGLGPIVGTRTFGGGIGGALYIPGLLDGGQITMPNRASYDPNGAWGIENEGVHPDIEVEWDPESWRAGKDPQLEAAVKAALAEIPKTKRWEPKKPAYPRYP